MRSSFIVPSIGLCLVAPVLGEHLEQGQRFEEQGFQLLGTVLNVRQKLFLHTGIRVVLLHISIGRMATVDVERERPRAEEDTHGDM